MQNLTSFSLETMLVSVQESCTVCAKRTSAQKWFWTLPMVLLGDEAQVKLVLVHLETALILTHDRCTVCVERTIGSEIILDAPDATPW